MVSNCRSCPIPPSPCRSSGIALERQLAAQRARRPADPLLSLVVPVFNEEEFDRPLPDVGEPLLAARRLPLRDRVRERRLARQYAGPSARPQRPRPAAAGRQPVAQLRQGGGAHRRHRPRQGRYPDADGHRPAGSARADRHRSSSAGARATTSSTACAASATSDTAAKRVSAGWFYWVFNSMSPVRIPANVGDFRLVDRRAIEVLRQLPERNRFMKGLFAWVGFNAIGVPYERPQRAAGSSKFNLWRLWNFALDGVVSFSTVPLRASFYGGAGDRRHRRALRPLHHHPRADVRHRHAGLRLAVDRRAADGRHPAASRSASSANISAACSSRSRAGRSTSSRASTRTARPAAPA